MMKFTEAIRKGYKTLKHGRGKLYDNYYHPAQACPIGAAFYILYPNTTVRSTTDAISILVLDYPKLLDSVENGSGVQETVSSEIISLNDGWREWSVEKIITWLEGLGL